MDNDGATNPSSSFLELRTVATIRVVVLLAALISSVCAGAFGVKATAYATNYLNLPLVVFLLLAILSWWLVYTCAKFARTLAYSQFFADVLLVTAAVYVTGGALSPFLFLYFAPVILSSLVVSRSMGIIVCFASAAAYSSLMTLLLRGWILTASGGRLVETPANGVLLQVVGLSSGLFLVAVLSSFLVSRLRVSYQLVEQQRKDILSLNQQQSSLVEGLPHGVITTDLEGVISHCNQAAGQYLQMSVEKLKGQKLEKVLQARLNGSYSLLPKDGQRIEIEIPGERDSKRQVVVHCRSVCASSGECTGSLFTFEDVTELREIEGQLATQERMARLLADRAPVRPATSGRISSFVGESPVMHKVFNLIDRVAPSDATVLISGESGTGKELVARAIHSGSTRAHKPFLALNCGAMPETLIESELFGYRKGAFTGADTDHIGMFRQAEGGTLFLDEIGELPMHLQSKLLRALQERAVRPVGGERDIPINVRILAASNRNLRRSIQDGVFREDLYYRLNVININLPPLRDRKDDIPLIVNSVLRRLVGEGSVPLLPPETTRLLMDYSYPGNVRELENMLERALVLGGEVLLPEHLPEAVRQAQPAVSRTAAASNETRIIIDEQIEIPVDLDKLLSGIERKYLELALVKTNGAKKKAAELLGMNFRSFRYRLQKFDIDSAD